MIKLVTILKGNDRISRAEFETRWRDVHAPIAAKFPGLSGYMLSFSIEPGDPAAEGVAQLWFDDRRSAQEAYASRIGREGSADASAYLARRDHLLASESWLKNSVSLSQRPYKLVLGVKRGDMPRKAFVSWWDKIDGDAVADATGADQIRLSIDEEGKLLNSGTSGDLGLRDGEAVFDGLLEIWFESADAAREGAQRFASSPLRSELVSAVARSEDFLLREHVIVRPPDPAYGIEDH